MIPVRARARVGLYVCVCVRSVRVNDTCGRVARFCVLYALSSHTHTYTPYRGVSFLVQSSPISTGTLCIFQRRRRKFVDAGRRRLPYNDVSSDKLRLAQCFLLV